MTGRTKRRALLAGLALAPFVLALFVVVSAMYGAVRALTPPRVVTPRPDATKEFEGLRDVAFRTEDGLELRGWYVPPRNGATILYAHGKGGNRADLLPEARLLSRAGYGALLYDSRAHGTSDGERLSYGDHERADVRAAIAFLTALPGEGGVQLGAYGFSAGASPVAMVAADDPRIRAVVLGGATTTMRAACRAMVGSLGFLTVEPILFAIGLYGVDVESIHVDRAAERLAPRPLLLVHGENDPFIPADLSRAIFATAREPKQLLVIPGGGHGRFLEVDPERYSAELLRFFDRALRGLGGS